MLDGIVDSSVGLVLVCAFLAAVVVLPAYMSSYMQGFAIPAPVPTKPAKFPLRSFARAALVAFVLLVNAAGLLLAHRLPVGSDLVSAGFLMLLFLPPDKPGESETRWAPLSRPAAPSDRRPQPGDRR